MNAREAEDDMLARCAMVAHGTDNAAAHDRREANVFRVAAMVVRSRFPNESARLMQVSEEYFSRRPDDRLPAADVVRNGWVISLPRLRDRLSIELLRLPKEERSRLTREALADVDAGRAIDHQAVQAWADSLSSTDTSLPAPHR